MADPNVITALLTVDAELAASKRKVAGTLAGDLFRPPAGAAASADGLRALTFPATAPSGAHRAVPGTLAVMAPDSLPHR
ncbi:hypothetical protein [Nocardia sp. NPDC127526]|uniref:hypothetical protein n=1 Tax=Nocardia sp. NPDC127526 TaxID=3345393 RepID=UPI003625C81B